jgi:DinB superfamily
LTGIDGVEKMHRMASNEPSIPGPDPVDSPDAYRLELIRWLDGDDPARVQAATVARLRALVAAAGPNLRLRPEPTEWSVIECIGHLVDSEIIVSARARWIVAEDLPEIVGYDQDRWVDALAHRDDDPDALIDLFGVLRANNLRLWASQPEPHRQRVGLHRERGPESYRLMFELNAGHDRFHLDQAQRALTAVADR